MNNKKLAELIYTKKFTIENPGASTANLALDPVTLAIIIELITQLIGCFQSRGASVHNNLQNPGFFDRLGLRRRIFFAMGFSLYRKEGRAMYNSMISTGRTLTSSDIQQLLQGRDG